MPIADHMLLAAAAGALDRTGLDQPLQDRQEVAVVIAHLGGGDYDIEGGFMTDNKLNSVDVQVAKTPTGDIVTLSGQELEATMHSHAGSGPVKIDGKSVTLMGGGASNADRTASQTTGKPVYILNAQTSMIKVESVGGKVVVTRILTRKDYKEYLERARQAQQPPTP